MSLLISLQSEMLKTKRTASFYLTIITAAVVPFIFMMDVTFDGIEPKNRQGIFNIMFSEGFVMTGFAIFPLFVVLICTLLPQLEYKNNAWKQVLTSPQTKGNVFLAKFLNIHMLIVVFLITNQLLMLLCAVILHFMEPSYNVLNQPIDGYKIFVGVINTYVTLLAICAIQFWMGLRFKNFIAPIGIGIALWFIGAMLALEFKSSVSAYFPYSFHVYSLFPNLKSQLNEIQWKSVGCAVVFLGAAFIDFKRRGNR